MFKNKYVSIVIVAIIAIVVIVFIVNDFNKKDVPSEDNKEEITDGDIGIILSDDSGSAEIKQIPITDESVNNDGTIDIKKEQELNYPNLNRTVVFPDSLSEDARVIINSNITTLKAKLKIDKDSFSDWLDLAMQYKIAEDYEGARDIWEFLNVAFLGNSISFNNLGDLYHYYLKDFPKSEENFRKAIENDKNNTQSYIGLHELYKYSYKRDTVFVTEVLLEGIRENLSNMDLLVTLAAYYKETEDNTNAKKYYEQARDGAQKLGNTQLIELLNEEISKL